MGQFRDSPNEKRSTDPRNRRDRGSNERDRRARDRAQTSADVNAAIQNQYNEAQARDQYGNVGGTAAQVASAFLPFGGAISPLLQKAGQWGGEQFYDLTEGGGGFQNRFGGPNNQQQFMHGDRGGNMGMLNDNYGGVGTGQRDNRSPGQIEMDRQDQFLQYAGGMYHPGMQRGEEASQALFDYYSGNPQAMQQQVNQSVMDSPFLAQNISLGEDAIARNRQATGGFRSGTTQKNLAQNSQNVYQNLYNQQLQQNLQGLGGFSDQGANQLNRYADFGRGMINDIGTTSGNIQSQNIAREANDQNFLTGIIGGVASGLGSYFGS